MDNPLYGIIIGLVIAGGGFALAWLAEIKWGWVLVVVGVYFLWIVLGQQDWSGIPAAPWSPFR